jgi:hypothetical protein
VILKWKTEWELNNHGFEIERSSLDDNLNVNSWTKIGFVAGKGTTSEANEYLFNDIKLNTGKYKYRLRQIDLNGNYEYFTCDDVVEIGLPSEFALSQNYPNPSNPVSKIDYQLPVESYVNISVYDLSGKLVKTLVDGNIKEGYHTVIFDGSNLASGIYIYRIRAYGRQNFTAVRKLVLIK